MTVSDLVADAPIEREGDAPTTDDGEELRPAPRPSRIRRVAMRPRRVIVKLHRWLALGLLAWLIIVSFTGAWLVVHDSVESVLHSDRFRSTSGDVGPQAAFEAAQASLPAEATVYGLTTPRNGRGVYQVYAELYPPTTDDEGVSDDEASTALPAYLTAFVDPGTGEVNGVRDEEEGFSWWLYRGHMYLWQDYGMFGVFDPEDGWCRKDADGGEPTGVHGVVCDVIPDGMDMVGWLAIGFLAVIVSGFYLWYWPGVRRWATAFVVRRGRGKFTFNLTLHKVVGFVVWIPLTAVAFTGAAFAFPNMAKWFENVTPAQRDFELWLTPEDLASSPADGRPAIGLDRAAAIIAEQYPNRALNYLEAPWDETATYLAWVTRGFDPWTREGGAGNAYLALDQYTGETLYDGVPGDGNVFDQAWDDWSFPTHTGDFGGTATRVVWVVLGLSPLVLATTGLTMNLIRRQKRARRR